MKRFVETEDRRQGVLLPEYLDDWVAEENPARVIDVFVDELDLGVLGFEGVVPEATGRPAYRPGLQLKIYIYGYINQIASSRRLEREAQRNVEMMWLLPSQHKQRARRRSWAIARLPKSKEVNTVDQRSSERGRGIVEANRHLHNDCPGDQSVALKQVQRQPLQCGSNPQRTFPAPQCPRFSPASASQARSCRRRLIMSITRCDRRIYLAELCSIFPSGRLAVCKRLFLCCYHVRGYGPSRSGCPRFGIKGCGIALASKCANDLAVRGGLRNIRL
jgi:transposase